MDFVTVTDHNAIGGALMLKEKHPSDVFIGEEITAYFPENGCKMHIVAWDLTEEQHREIQPIRENIIDLAAYLQKADIFHSVAHPFYQNNERLTLDQFEKLILLFKHFEGINGLRDPLTSSLAVDILRSLTPEIIVQLADRHGIEPRMKEPHIKFFTGGSDDHSSIFIARAHSVTPRAATCAEFLRHLREGRGELGGKPGSPFVLSHGLYNIAYLYYSDKLQRGSKSGHELMVKVFENFVAGRNLARFTLGQRIRHAFRKLTRKRKTAEERDLSLSSQLSLLLRHDGFQKGVAEEIAQNEEVETRSFRIACRIVNQLSYNFFCKVLQRVSEGNFLDGLQALSALVPVALGAAPYLVGFRRQGHERQLMMDACRKFRGRLPPELSSQKRVWFTDTLQDVNGVSHTIHKICEVARRHEREIQVVTSKARLEPTGFSVRNFPPVGEFKLPEYEELQIAFPPLLEILEYCWREKFCEVVISTPGPLGLVGLMTAKLLGLRASGIYHTDFPQYVRVLTEDENMAGIAWKYMEWFYGLLDRVYVPSEAYKSLLLEHGFAEEKLKIMPRGIDCEAFSPAKRDPRYWEMFGGNGQVKFLYVGRVSKEKDLETLAEAYEQLHREHPEVLLSVVGEGPYLTEFRRRLPKGSAVFTGFLSGEALQRAYASADIFVFPSSTDTFGNVVLEAQASGLPAIVSDRGGPRELIEHGVSGLITRAKDAASLLDAMRQFVRDPSMRERMGATARGHMGERSWERAFQDFWEIGDR
jgi:glycosyltransferase involved in cell wall biosynthesis